MANAHMQNWMLSNFSTVKNSHPAVSLQVLLLLILFSQRNIWTLLQLFADEDKQVAT